MTDHATLAETLAANRLALQAAVQQLSDPEPVPSTASTATPSSSPQTGRKGTGPADDASLLSSPLSAGAGGTEPPEQPDGWGSPRYDGWTRIDPTPLPGWVTGFRDPQVAAVEQIVDAYNRGIKVVFLSAPTGAGKTLIGEMVRRRVAERTVYACNGLGLQDQFARDYPYAAVLKGKSNYPTQTMPWPDVTCADCTRTDGACMWCPVPLECDYRQARRHALMSRLVVTNTAYLLAETRGEQSGLAGRDLMIIDEADTLEGVLMGAVEFRVTGGLARRLGVTIPGKSVHKPTIKTWIEEELVPAAKQQRARVKGSGVEQTRERARLTRLIDRARMVAGDLEGGLWTRDYGGKGRGRDGYGDDLDLVLKAVKVDKWGSERVWRHAERWLLMSATIISPDEMVDSLGIEGGRGEPGGWETVEVPMTFPVENRLVHAIPIADMSKKNREEGWARMVEGVEAIAARHPDEKILVHTVSYALADHLKEQADVGSRKRFAYRGSRERERVVEQFRASDNGILYAPSVDRGFDFKGDDARVVVIAKIPFPNLGDRVVGERMRLDGGQEWYAVQMVRGLVQMTGRGVRSETDWCTTYVLDQAMYTNVLKRSKRLLPKWWLEALDETITPRELWVMGARGNRAGGDA